MVDFKKLRKSKAKHHLIKPRDIFNSLPKPLGINDLYASQAEVLDIWFGRRTDVDIVVKLHTGGGKTLVALLIAQSIMNEISDPVIYLAPTNQLVKQVITQSKEYGISTVPYRRGEQLSPNFLDGKSVLVGSYESLFNGRSKFGVQGSGKAPVKAGAIILDDAHVAFSSVRNAFSLTISSSAHNEVYLELAGRFRNAFLEVNRIGAFSDITSGKDFGIVEVPSWAWQRKIIEIQDYISKYVKEIDPYVWPLLRDNLAVCHCLFSSKAVTITPVFPLVDLIPTFADCRRRIYMSATIADDSEIVRTFCASPKAVQNPITSTSLAGVGERMILVPDLMKLGDVHIKQMVKNIAIKLAERKAGSVILTPSRHAAQEWIDVADFPSDTDTVLERVTDMQTGTFYGPLVLANRYDGIDLAGSACRFLVMGDLPQGTTDYDMFRVNVAADTVVNSLLAQRIEQGIGRGTRGGGDYCVVVLVGSKLVGWIGRKQNLASLTASTRVQLKMGQEISEAIETVEEVVQTIKKCLDRDDDWVVYHASELADAAHAVPVDDLALRVAGVEQRVVRLQRLGQYGRALQKLEKLILDPELKDDPQRQAWLSAMAARIAYQIGDETRGQEFQTKAFTVNNNHTPAKIRPAYVPRAVPSGQSVRIVGRLLKYEHRRSLLADYNEAITELVSEATATRYEEALANLGSFLGFEAERPDKVYDCGPDVLWRTDADFDFVIEAKSNKKITNPLYKTEHAQLLEAEQWFKDQYPDRKAIRVSALPEAVADEKATPSSTYALRLDDITKLVSSLRGVLSDLVEEVGDENALRDNCEISLKEANLKPYLIKEEFLLPFKKQKRI